jgi:hypothetical protein
MMNLEPVSVQEINAMMARSPEEAEEFEKMSLPHTQVLLSIKS